MFFKRLIFHAPPPPLIFYVGFAIDKFVVDKKGGCGEALDPCGIRSTYLVGVVMQGTCESYHVRGGVS